MAFVQRRRTCEACAGDAIPHRFTYATIVINETLWKLFPQDERKGPMRSRLSDLEKRVEEAVSLPMLDGFVLLGLARTQREPDDGTLLLARTLWEEARTRGIDMYEWRLFGLPRNILVARFPNGRRIAFEGIPDAARGYGEGEEQVPWMDDKARLKKEFQKRGLPVAQGDAARTLREALAIYRRLTRPVIVKPHAGSASRHTVLHITDEASLLRAFSVAKQVSPCVVVEEELRGPVFRATVVDGKFVAALRRDPPHVVSDGTHTVTELVGEANKHPARKGPYFSKLEINERADEELSWQGLTRTSVPPKGSRVSLHQKVNWALGGTTCDVTDDVHPDNRTLFERAALELHAPVTGIDFIINDISRSWKDQERCGILECNSMPFFDNHHVPFEGQPRNVAGTIWDMVTPSYS